MFCLLLLGHLHVCMSPTTRNVTRYMRGLEGWGCPFPLPGISLLLLHILVCVICYNSELWIGINEIINKLQDFQNRFMLRFCEAPKQGTPTGIVELDANMLLMKNLIMLSKLTYVGKLMVNSAPI